MTRNILKDKNKIHYWLLQINQGKSVDEYSSFFHSLPKDEKSAFLNQADGSGKTLLHNAFFLRRMDWVNFLISQDVNMLQKDRTGWNCFNYLTYSAYMLNKEDMKFSICEIFTQALEVSSKKQFIDIMDLLFYHLSPFSAKDLMIAKEFDLYMFLLKDENKEKHEIFKEKIGMELISSALLHSNALFVEKLHTNLNWDIFDIIRKNHQDCSPLCTLLRFIKGERFWNYSFSKPFLNDSTSLSKEVSSSPFDEIDFALYNACLSMKGSNQDHLFIFDFLLNLGFDPHSFVPSRKDTLLNVIKKDFSSNVISTIETAISKKQLKESLVSLNKNKMDLNSLSNKRLI